MSNRVCEMLLENYNEYELPKICKTLNLELYQEDNLITISGKEFVLDINSTDAACSISFVEDSYKPYFRHVEVYLNTALKNKDYLMFYYLLKYFVETDRCTKEVNGKCKVVRRGTYLICECIFGTYCSLYSLHDVIKHKINIFTHQNEKLWIVNDTMFSFKVIDKKVSFYGEMIAENEVEEKILSNFLFYRAIDESVEFANNEIIGYTKKGQFIVTYDLAFYVVENGDRIRNKVCSHLLKRGLPLKEIVEYVDCYE